MRGMLCWCTVTCYIFFFQQYSLRPATLLKKRLWQRYFPVNFAEFLRIPFYRTPLVAASFFCIQACIFSFYKTLALIRQSVLNFLFWFHFVNSWDHISHNFIFYEYTDTETKKTYINNHTLKKISIN